MTHMFVMIGAVLTRLNESLLRCQVNTKKILNPEGNDSTLLYI